jgi:hypothetical protein
LIGLGLVGSLYYDIFQEPRPKHGDKTVLIFVMLVKVQSVGLLADLIEKRSRL